MQWKRPFDTENALSKAMEVFWVRGYEATSMQDLVDCMGIGRCSLHVMFGDKRSLFIQALRRYDRCHRSDWTRRLARSPSGKRAIVAAFDEVIAAALDGGCRNGCLLVNTALELSPRDREIGQVISRCLSDMELFFRDQLVRAQAAGEVSNTLSPDRTAKTLLALLVGLRVFTHARFEPYLMRAVAVHVGTLLR